MGTAKVWEYLLSHQSLGADSHSNKCYGFSANKMSKVLSVEMSRSAQHKDKVHLACVGPWI